MAPGTHHALILLIDQQLTLSNLTYGGVLERFPELKVDRARVRRRLGRALDGPARRVPRELRLGHTRLVVDAAQYFQRQCWVSFDPGERTAPLLWPLIGGDRITWASDFPHSDAKYPGVVDELREYTEGWTPTRAGLFGRNAAAMYSL